MNASQVFEKLDKSGGEDSCWEWRVRTDPRGYGVVFLNHKQNRVHRVIWEYINGPIPDGLNVCHKCDNLPCANPKHLFLGTNSDNMRDMCLKGRSGSGKLSIDQVVEIKKRIYENSIELAKEFPVTPDQIRSIRSGRCWGYLHTREDDE